MGESETIQDFAHKPRDGRIGVKTSIYGHWGYGRGEKGEGINFFRYFRFLMVFDDVQRFFCVRLKFVQWQETAGSFDSPVVFNNFK